MCASDSEETVLYPGEPADFQEPPVSGADDHRVVAGRYLLRRVIGHGAFGVVHLADDLKIGRIVAIKQLYGRQTGYSMIFDRFIQEVKIAGRLEHPNIIILYNLEETPENTYMVMEYLGGGNLADLMRANRKMELRVAVRIMQGIMHGLQAAHEIMVVHRDIKPQNILFGIGGVPKITDFGVARLPANAGGSESLDTAHESGMVIGTPVYMSPEQLAGGAVDCRSDIYSSGVLFYEMLANERPVDIDDGLSLAEIGKKAAECLPKPLDALRPDLPPVFSRIIGKMLAKDPGERYSSVAEVNIELLKALSEVKRGEIPWATEDVYPSSLFWSSPAAILEDIIYLFLVDRVISPEERRELNYRIERLGISNAQAHEIENKVRERLGLPLVS